MEIKSLFSSFKNSAGKMVGEIMLYGPIGQGSMWEEENSCKDFIAQLNELTNTCSQINVRINSEGGSVTEGIAIASAISKSKVPVYGLIDGLCASISTIIACACTKTIMCSNGLYMVHSPLSRVSGNAHDMKEMIKILDKIEEAIMESYIEKCGDKCSKEQIKQFLASENNDGTGTWMTAKEAKKYGFVDEIGHELKMVAQIEDPSNAIINGIKMDLSGFKNTEKLKELIENKNSDKLEETNMSKISNSGLATMIDNIANSIKSSLGIKAEAEIVGEEPETTVGQTEEVIATEPEVAQEENLEVQSDEQIQDVTEEIVELVAEETEVQPEIVEPSAEVETEEIEPSSEETEPVAIVEPEAEIIAEAQEPAQEETEIAEEQLEVTEEPEVAQEEVEEEIEPSTEIEPEAIIVPEVNASIDLVKQVADLTAKLKAIEAQDAEKAVKLAKAELAKEIGNKFKGVPGKLEDKVELVYELKNSALSESSKEMIFKSLENLSAQNLEACQELGHSEEVIVDELDELSKAKAMSQKEGISEGQALLVMSGKRTLAQAKAVKRK